MKIIPHLVYFLAGVSALYLVLAPKLSELPNLQAGWVTAALWVGAILLLAASLIVRDFGSRLAIFSSSIRVALYSCFMILPIVARLGYYHVESRIVATHEVPTW